ncbi:MAG TPA: MFS transporter [Chloroflexota bacterium]
MNVPGRDLARHSDRPDGTDYPRVGLIGAGHLVNDMYGNFITSLMPYLVLRGAISTTIAGMVLLVYLVGSSVMQPVFGLLSDRTGRRWFAVTGALWLGMAASLVGWVDNPALLLALVGLGGLGTAAFHPQGATMIDAISPTNKGRAMALFAMGGNVGFAIGPLIAAAIATAGLHWSPIILVPGVFLTLALARFAPHPGHSNESIGIRELCSTVGRTWHALTLIVAIIAIRSAAQYVLIIFLPLYYHLRGFPAELGSYDAVGLSLTGALGGLAGGHLSDVYGRRPVVVASLLISAPLLTVALLVPAPLVWPLIALSGATLLASNSVTVVQGQELLPRSRGLSSGLTLGLGFGLSGVVASGVTVLSDHIGVREAIFAAPVLALCAAVLAVFVQGARSLAMAGEVIPYTTSARAAE